MITCQLMGGLGNQLFQIFTTIAYSLDSKVPFYFHYSKSLGKRPTYWDTFLQPLKKYTKNLVLPAIVLREKAFHYNELPLSNSEKNIMLSGYFQSNKYFAKHAAYIREHFLNLTQQQEEIKNSVFLQIDDNYENAISMHFRMGDYKFLQDCHPILHVQYYKKCLETIIENTRRKIWRVIYFCEDEDIVVINEYITYLESKFPECIFSRANRLTSDWQQLIMMSCCKHHIIANSSFSWWGAYLHFAEPGEKIVCYPNAWFGPKLAHNIRDLIPDNETWIRI